MYVWNCAIKDHKNETLHPPACRPLQQAGHPVPVGGNAVLIFPAPSKSLPISRSCSSPPDPVKKCKIGGHPVLPDVTVPQVPKSPIELPVLPAGGGIPGRHDLPSLAPEVQGSLLVFNEDKLELCN